MSQHDRISTIVDTIVQIIQPEQIILYERALELAARTLHWVKAEITARAAS